MEGTRRARDLVALHRLASVAPRSVDEEIVVHEVLSAVDEVVPSQRAVLLLYDPDTDQLWLQSSVGGERTRLSMSEPSVVRRVFHTGRGEVVNDLMTDPDSSPLVAEALRAKQLVAVPLSAGGRKLGVLAALNSRKGPFSQEDLVALSLLADQASLAIENAQLRNTLERQGQEIEGLHRLSRLLASSDSVDDVIAESVRIVADLLNCGSVALMLHEEESNCLVGHPRGVGFSADQVEGLRVSLSHPSLVGTVFRTDAPLISNDVKNDAWVDSELRELLDTQTILIVPLTTISQPMGVLMATDAQKAEFDDGDVRFAMLLGARIGGVIEASKGRERERGLLQKLRELDQTKSEFVSMLAHELKGPMTTIIGFGSVLRDSWAAINDEKRSHILEVMTKEMDRLSRLVTDLLDLSRIEAGTLRYEMKPVSLVEVVGNILEIHSSLRERHAIVCVIPDDLPQAWGDADRLRQVLLNLITNAIRYSPDETTVTVDARVSQNEEGEERTEIVVTDEGIGISGDDLERVFAKFSTIDKPAWVPKGTGLGLYITRGIVEAHGGTMWVESEPGKGSSFHFTLRLADQSEH
jgi:signal transduction histidine kinase